MQNGLSNKIVHTTSVSKSKVNFDERRQRDEAERVSLYSYKGKY